MPLTDLNYGDYLRAHAINSNFGIETMENVNTFPGAQSFYINSYQANFFARAAEYVAVYLFNNAILAINLLLILTFPLVAVSTHALLYYLKIPYPWNFLMSLIFTFLPTHFLWLRYGFSTSNYSAIPIGLLLVFFIFFKNDLKLRHYIYIILGLIYVSMSNLYFVEFFIYLFLVIIIFLHFLKQRVKFYKIKLRIFYFMFFGILLLTVFQFAIDISLLNLSAQHNPRIEDNPGSSSPFHTGGGYFWSQFIANPFGQVPLLSSLFSTANSFFHNYSQYFGCNFNKYYPKKSILVELCYSDVEKYSYFPILISLALLLIIIKVIRETYTRSRSLNDYETKLLFFLLISTQLYWFKGGVGNYVALFFPYFRSFSRLMIVSVLIIMLLVYRIVIKQLNQKIQKSLLVICSILFFLDSILPSWNPILMKYTTLDPSNFRLNLVSKNYDFQGCTLISYPVRSKFPDTGRFNSFLDARLIHLLSHEPGLKVSTALLADANSPLNNELTKLSRLKLDELIVRSKELSFCGLIVDKTMDQENFIELYNSTRRNVKFNQYEINNSVDLILFKR